MNSEKLLAEVKEKYENAYRKQTPKSRAAIEVAKKYMPGGQTRRGTFYFPYPIWTEKAEGCKLTDVDGNEYIDFHGCYTTMIVGHGNPKVVEAVKQQLARSVADSTMSLPVIRWAEIMCQRVDSVEEIRFTNSGTEGAMGAIRGARGFTGKDKIIKTEGCFHGSWDPTVYPTKSLGLPQSILTDSITIPYNDNQAAEKAIVENKDQLAAMILEGQMGVAGQIPPKDGYLNFLRKITAENNVLLILDEVQSFRLDHGGMQHIQKVKPDLTLFGKIIGGGFPAGAFGGRKDIMELFSPWTNKISHTGTFSGNPITATAGIATLEQVTPEAIAKINKLGESLATGIRQVFTKLNIKGQVTGTGSLQNVHFSPVPVVDGKTSAEANKDILHLFHLALMGKGIFSVSRGLFAISIPMTEKEIDTAVKAVEATLSDLLPSIEQLWPELIGTPIGA